MDHTKCHLMLFSNTKQEFIQKYVLSPNKHIFLKSLISSLLYVFHKTFIYCLGSTLFVYSHGYLYFRDSHWGIYVYACPILYQHMDLPRIFWVFHLRLLYNISFKDSHPGTLPYVTFYKDTYHGALNMNYKCL